MGVSDDQKMTAFIHSNRNVQVQIYILPGFGSMKTLPSSGSLMASSSSKNGIMPDWQDAMALTAEPFTQLFRNHLRQHNDVCILYAAT